MSVLITLSSWSTKLPASLIGQNEKWVNGMPGKGVK